jgi:LssY C-terminus/Ankyrin repeats (many copies)
MPISSKHSFLFLLLLLFGVSTVPGTKLIRPETAHAAAQEISAQPEDSDAKQSSAETEASTSQAAPRESGQSSENQVSEGKQEPDRENREEEETPEDELAPAALQLDEAKASPLIGELYQATRETKEKEILARLENAKALLASGADVKATDAQGRTALHWAVFGSSYNTKPSIVVAYEEVADRLIAQGVDLNREDVYQDTAFDYLLYSPNFEMQTLLIEHGASSGFFAAFFHFFNEQGANLPQTPEAAIARSRKADLTPGLTLSVRLDDPVYSDRSRTGDPFSATVTYPLCKRGESIECDPGDLLLGPGTKVNGTILFASKAPDKYSRPRLVLDFSNIVHKNGQRSPLYARVLDVDNARETVANNEILGIVQPHASTKVAIAAAAVSAANPIAGYTLKGIQTVYGLSIRREVNFPAGTDMQIQVVRPSMLKQKDDWPGWKQLPMTADLQKIVAGAPLRTATPKNVASDPVNLMFLGSKDELIAAFGEAHWFAAADLGIGSGLKVAQATIRQTGYADAPTSLLMVNGRAPDLVFQKSLDTFAKRHHIRIWKMTQTYEGREVWVGAATHDIATTKSRANTKWSHRIDPHIDRERDWVETDLLFVGTGLSYVDVNRPHAPKKLANATGDEIVTDGKIAVVELAKKGQATTPVLSTRQ